MDFKQIQQAICDAVANDKQKAVHNHELVKTIELCGNYLNAETIPDYGRRHGKDYSGAKYLMQKNNLKTFQLFNVTFVIDND